MCIMVSYPLAWSPSKRERNPLCVGSWTLLQHPVCIINEFLWRLRQEMSHSQWVELHNLAENGVV